MTVVTFRSHRSAEAMQPWRSQRARPSASSVARASAKARFGLQRTFCPKGKPDLFAETHWYGCSRLWNTTHQNWQEHDNEAYLVSHLPQFTMLLQLHRSTTWGKAIFLDYPYEIWNILYRDLLVTRGGPVGGNTVVALRSLYRAILDSEDDGCYV